MSFISVYSKLLDADHLGNMNYTMQNKFSNCFVWVNPSTSDLKCHEDTSASHLTRISIKKFTELPNAAVMLDFKISGHF